MKRNNSNSQLGRRSKILHTDSDNVVANIEKESKRNPYVESISLKNFMCHSRLTMRFSSGVNFIVGHNGSGKSAILTAIMVALGGKASSTSRGNSLKALIKTGCSFSSIEITLKNIGDDQYQPEVYGKKIIVDLRISIDGATSYKLKNSDGKLISVKKKDLLGILDYMNLYVDNPLTCLTQEMSKNFLHSKNAGDKYKFFMKSTQLEQMKIDYAYIREQKSIMEITIERKEKALPGIKSEVKEKKLRFLNLKTLKQLEDKMESLKREHAWAQVMMMEESVKPLQHDLDREKNRLPKYDEAVKKSAVKEKKIGQKFKELQAEGKMYHEQLAKLETQKNKAKNKYSSAKTHHKTVIGRLEQAKQQQNVAEKDRMVLQERIDELKMQVESNVEEECKKKEENLVAFTQQRDRLQAQHKCTQHQIDQFSQSIQRSKEQLHLIKQDENDLQQRVRSIKQNIASLSGSKRNKLQLFGKKMPEFVSAIEKAFINGKFAHKPRGPMGSYITVKDQQLVHPVECAVRSYLHSFIVDNHKDEKILEGIRNSLFQPHEYSRIVIYTKKFQEQVYDISHGKVNHPGFLSVFDLLKIQDVMVANCLIDMASIERVLVIPNTQDALSIIQKQTPPRNCIKAFTKEGDEVYTDRFYSYKGKSSYHYLKADIEGEIAKHRAESNELSCQIEEIKRHRDSAFDEIKKNENELRQHNKAKATLMHQINKVKVDIQQIELEMADITQDLDVNDLEDEVQNYTQQVENLCVVIEEEQRNTQESTQVIKSSKKLYEDLIAEIKNAAEKTDSLIKMIETASHNLEKAKGERSHFDQGRKKQLETIDALQVRYDSKMKEVEEETERARKICPEKIKTKRMPNNLDNEIQHIVKRIQKEEEEKGNHETIVCEYHDAKTKYSEIINHIKWSKNFISQIEDYLQIRNRAFTDMRQMISIRCSLDFDKLLFQRGFIGKMNFDHERQELQISVKPHDNTQETKDMKALSGGERSFSTVCYILSLWQSIQPPLRCLDEFDVFMDMANRKVAMDMMTEIALDLNKAQFIFLTPHDISALQKSPRISVWKMPDPDRGQTTLPFTPV